EISGTESVERASAASLSRLRSHETPDRSSAPDRDSGGSRSGREEHTSSSEGGHGSLLGRSWSGRAPRGNGRSARSPAPRRRGAGQLGGRFVRFARAALAGAQRRTGGEGLERSARAALRARRPRVVRGLPPAVVRGRQGGAQGRRRLLAGAARRAARVAGLGRR